MLLGTDTTSRQDHRMVQCVSPPSLRHDPCQSISRQCTAMKSCGRDDFEAISRLSSVACAPPTAYEMESRDMWTRASFTNGVGVSANARGRPTQVIMVSDSPSLSSASTVSSLIAFPVGVAPPPLNVGIGDTVRQNAADAHHRNFLP
jgi:hypothetical protein